ncbi:hypothetical protein F4809DRAFT_650910 [Biscogniauxia mediterranea]|nr:hypothetical protein F4809DRAFT_650910 [Biscogniauxia mediterranea]
MSHGRQVLDDLLGILGLSSTRLASDQDALIFPFINEVTECFIGHGEYVRLHIFSVPALVHVDIFVRIYRQGAVGLVPDVEVMNNRRLIEMGQFSHIIRLVELGRVDLIHAFAIDLPLLKTGISRILIDHPTFNEGGLWILEPDISPPRKVILALYPLDNIYAPSHVLGFDEGGRKGLRREDSRFRSSRTSWSCWACRCRARRS